ncbi:hypothetical protein SAICODRAFT_63065 [Saitoella complicata NRRL Y-17804]|uniref:uncharacterized protein n=1 Tax=Saitoella complicata (strain BCRC 22490 / CBS 7301 / JCM 7358 / NBRC 10748 / NRRL Y-17804) TaxID=698492 RepID=UPI000866EFFB|nr:uncharacterized protein SAICODRAFT_63065 [Saitoella complicata NRRL Y-17804]ODQ55935.1 hypothetical protein SAICODRAFT_63065 [Saitoella complicata NRRL Y-17804]
MPPTPQSVQPHVGGAGGSGSSDALLFAGLERLRTEKAELEGVVAQKDTEIHRLHSTLTDLRTKTTNVKSRFAGLSKFVEGLGRDHDEMKREQAAWVERVRGVKSDVQDWGNAIRDAMRGVEECGEGVTEKRELIAFVKDLEGQLSNSQLHRNNLLEQCSHNAGLLAEERDRVQSLEADLRRESTARISLMEKFEEQSRTLVEEAMKKSGEGVEGKIAEVLKAMEGVIDKVTNVIEEEGKKKKIDRESEEPAFVERIRSGFRDEIESLTSSFSKLHDDARAVHEKRAQELSATIEALRGGKHDLLKALTEKDAEIRRMEEQVKASEEKMRNEREKSEMEKKERATKEEVLKQRLSTIEKDLRDRIDAKPSAEQVESHNVVRQLRAESDAIKAELETVKDKARKEVEEAKKAVGEKMAELVDVQGKIQAMKDSSNAGREELATLKADMEKFKAQCQQQFDAKLAEHERSARKVKEADAAQHQNLIKAKDNKISRLEKELTELKARRVVEAESSERIEQMETELEELIGRSAKEKGVLEKKASELEKDLASLQSKVESQQSTVSKQREEFMALHTAKSHIEKSAADKVVQLEKEIDLLHKQQLAPSKPSQQVPASPFRNQSKQGGQGAIPRFSHIAQTSSQLSSPDMSFEDVEDDDFVEVKKTSKTKDERDPFREKKRKSQHSSSKHGNSTTPSKDGSMRLSQSWHSGQKGFEVVVNSAEKKRSAESAAHAKPKRRRTSDRLKEEDVPSPVSMVMPPSQQQASRPARSSSTYGRRGSGAKK